MKSGLRVYDADTHVSPSAEILERYLDPSIRPRLTELAPYRHDTGDGLHSYGFGRKFYRRVLGEAMPRETFTGRESRWRGSKMPRPGGRTLTPPTASWTWTTRGRMCIS